MQRNHKRSAGLRGAFCNKFCFEICGLDEDVLLVLCLHRRSQSKAQQQGCCKKSKMGCQPAEHSCLNHAPPSRDMQSLSQRSDNW